MGIHINDIPKGIGDPRWRPITMKARIKKKFLNSKAKADAKQYNFANTLLSFPTLELVKCSVLLFLLRLRETSRRLRVLMWLHFSVNLIWLVACDFIVLFQCYPIAYQWDKSIHGGHCRDFRSTYISISIMAVLTGISVLTPPVFIVIRKKMQRRLKIAVMFLFLLGIM